MAIARNARIYVAGHRGLVGSAIWRELARARFHQPDRPHPRRTGSAGRRRRPRILPPRTARICLHRRRQGRRHPGQQPQPVAFLYENLHIQNNLIHGAYESRRAESSSSSAAPAFIPSSPRSRSRKNISSPARSNPPTNGTPSPRSPASNFARPSASNTAATSSPPCPPTCTARTTITISKPPTSCPRSSTNFTTPKSSRAPAVTCWGTGAPLREFLHADDLAEACLFLMENYSDQQFINVGSGSEISIRELAELVKTNRRLSRAKSSGTNPSPTARRAN